MPRRPGVRHVAPPLAITAVLVLAAAAEAQTVRGSVRSQLRYLEAHTIVQDTVSRERVVERPDGALEFEGRPVVCLDGQPCLYYRPGSPQSAMALFQDLEATAWGLGTEGLSATVLLRHRESFGNGFTMPRSDDRFDAVLAYMELNRDRYRVRLGRQRTLSQLGPAGFDGLEVRVDPVGTLRLHGYAGRSLARGLSEPRQAALRGLDDAFFLPDQQALIVGAEAAIEPAAGTDVSLRYQAEIWADRGGMLSDRASLSARTVRWRPIVLSGAVDYDLGFGNIGRAHLTVQHPFAGNRMVLEASGRRYVPYFEMWTIWGFFSPVAYHEGTVRATWRPGPATSAWAAGGYRRYDDHDAPVIFEPLKRENWRAEFGAQRRIAGDFMLAGAYRWEGPVGALVNGADASVAWRPEGRLGAAVQGVLFEQAEEFRIGTGRVLGLGGSLDLDLWDGASVAGGVDVFRQTWIDRPTGADWNQTRAWMVLRLGFGPDAGAGRRAR